MWVGKEVPRKRKGEKSLMAVLEEQEEGAHLFDLVAIVFGFEFFGGDSTIICTHLIKRKARVILWRVAFFGLQIKISICSELICFANRIGR